MELNTRPIAVDARARGGVASAAMRLYSGKITPIAEELVRALTTAGDIEVESADEVRLDVEAVLKEYVRREREISEQAKNRIEARGLPSTQLGKLKAQIAKESGFATGEDTLPYLIEQILEMLFHSQNVTEVFAEDGELRKRITPVLRKHMDVEEDLDREVRARIKNLDEGTAAFEIEYQKVLEQMKRKKGLS
jgi:hypothetical protein